MTKTKSKPLKSVGRNTLQRASRHPPGEPFHGAWKACHVGKARECRWKGSSLAVARRWISQIVAGSSPPALCGELLEQKAVGEVPKLQFPVTTEEAALLVDRGWVTSNGTGGLPVR